MKINPLIPDFNETFDLVQINSAHFEEAKFEVLSESETLLNRIINEQFDNQTFENSFGTLDEIYNKLEKFMGIAYFAAYTHTNAEVREKSLAVVAEVEKFANDLILNQQLFEALKKYGESAKIIDLQPFQKKFINEILREFRRNGVNLSDGLRKELKTLKDRISELGLEFETNIAADNGFLVFDESELDGLPNDFKMSRKTDDGRYKIDLSNPSFVPFMKYAKNGEARKALFIKHKNRATDKNLDVLKLLISERKKLAHLLNYETFAHYQTENRMVKTPEKALSFENTLKQRVRTKAEADYSELLKLKTLENHQATEVINAWEWAYYENMLLKQKFEIDSELLKQYFELNNAISGLFDLARILFNVEFRKIENPSVWHESITAYEIIRCEKPIARFYLDLFPRENKYSHAAFFPIISGKKCENDYQMPLGALVCNFPKPTETTSSLLLHNDVVTLFHEFGHLMHGLLTRAEISAMAGTSVARDYVETPSQMFENWAWHYDSIKLFAKHYKTGELLPKPLFDKMKAAKNANSGLATLQQIFYGMIDLTFYTDYSPENQSDTGTVVKNLQNRITLFPFVEGTNFEASFGHLNGYAAGYYGYLWSKVYAEDVFSIFEKQGLLNPELGQRLLKTIIEKGSTIDEFQQLNNFLQREPNEGAFVKMLGI